MRRYRLHVMASLVLILLPCASGAFAEDFYVITGLGNTFPIEAAGTGPSGGGGGQDGVGGASIAELFGSGPRVVHKEYGGSVMYQDGAWAEESMKPYVRPAGTVSFASSISSGDPVSEAPVEFHGGGGSELGAAGETALGLETRTIHGDIALDGNTTEGQGRLILKLTGGYKGEPINIRAGYGDARVRLVETPEGFDLITLKYDSGRGFDVWHCTCNPGQHSHGRLVGSVDDSQVSAVFEYDQNAGLRVYSGKCCKGAYSITGTHHRAVHLSESDMNIASHPTGFLIFKGDRVDAELMNPNSIKYSAGQKTLRVNYNNVGNFEYRLYDTLPVKLIAEFQPGSEIRVDITAGDKRPKFLVIDSGGDPVEIGIRRAGDAALAEAGGLPPDTPYRLLDGLGRTMDFGSTGDGSVSFDGRRHMVGTMEVSPAIPSPGRLMLYDSPVYVPSGAESGTIVFDHANSEVMRLACAGCGDRIYNVHSYVKIPVSTIQMDVSAVQLGGLDLPYLAGTYPVGSSMHVPVIPGYGTIQVTANGQPVFLAVEDIPGSTGIHIAETAESTVERRDQGRFATSISSTAGTVTHVIATDDGTVRANVEATVSGESEITNYRRFVQAEVPQPPPPRPRDPLTTWVEVYVNGDLMEIGGRNQTQIFFSDDPAEDHAAGSSGDMSFHTARFSYPSVKVSGTISVPVSAADFVEFYFYTQIEAEGSIPPVPSRPGVAYTEFSRWSEATATAVLEHATIYTSQ